LSFYYSSPGTPFSFEIFSGPNDTGSLLADVTVPGTPSTGPGCNTDFCPWTPFSVTFLGTAKSVDFSGAAGEIAGFSAVTLCSTAPVIPEISTWAMMVIGFVGLSFAGYRAKRKNAALVA
jgi:hypothetical protein